MRASTARILARLALSLVVFAGMLVLFEVGFRLAGFRPLYEIYSKPSLFWRYDAQLGWSHTPGSRGVYRGPRPFPLEFENEIRINALGLRGAEVGEAPERGYRILFLGDSVVAGFEVAEHETFVVRTGKQLGARFPFPIETINAGVRGYGTDQSLLYFEQRGHRLRSDLVIFHHSANDPRNNMTLHRMRRPFGKGAFALEADGGLRPQGIPVPEYDLCAKVALDREYRVKTSDTLVSRTLCSLEMNLSDRSALFTYVTRLLQGSPELLRWLYRLGTTTEDVVRGGVGLFLPAEALADELDDSAARLTRAIIVAMKHEVEASGARFLLWISKAELEALGRSEIEAHGVDVLHTPIVMREQWATPVTFENDSHWNANGHRIVADLLTEKLAEHVGEAVP